LFIGSGSSVILTEKRVSSDFPTKYR